MWLCLICLCKIEGNYILALKRQNENKDEGENLKNIKRQHSPLTFTSKEKPFQNNVFS